MKINVGADTSEFTKGIKQAKSDLKSFGSVSDDVLGKVGQAIGIDTKQVEQMASAIRGMGQKMEQAGGEGATAFNKIATAAKGAGASIAAIGIAAAVASFKALNSEAEAFKNTIAGANIELQTKAYIDTYRQVFHDFNAETGQSVAEWEAGWSKAFARFKANLSQNFVKGITGSANVLETALGPIGSLLLGGNKAQQQAADAAATQAEQLAGEIFKIDRQRSDNLVKIAELERTIAESQRIMKDDSATLAERNAAYLAATQAINDKYALQLPLMQQRAGLMQEMVGLAGSTVQQVDEANRAQAEAIKLEGQQQDELRSLDRMAKSITSANNANNAALREQLRLQKEIAQSRASLKDLNLGVSGGLTTGAVSQIPVGLAPRETPEAFQELLNAHFGETLHISIGVDLDKQRFVDVSRELEMVLGQMANNLGEIIGGLIGDLVTGGDAWSNFANAAMSAFGDMAITVGKIAIATGLATESIKGALTKLGGLGAIAAGIALVALGTAVKTGLSNVAGGNYSASPNVASSGYGYGGGDYETRDVNIHVNGKLEADGDSLVAVINSTNNRNGYTT